uniref:Guanine nucleotide binding protein (G protein) alpha v1 n=1 Tax=Astyanax mexicanus TaxID=7994 RepID=A0A8B9JR13_ASTMX
MGLCFSSEVTEEGKKAKIQSAQIDRELYQHAKREMNIVKILLLGAAESGKSTLVKQMKIIHSHGFNQQELASFKLAVLDNLLNSMKFVLHGMGVLRINLANNKNKVHAHSVLSCGRCFDEEQVLFPFVGHALCCLWADQGVRSAAARGYEYELNDSALYFFENMSRIVAADYVPTEMDVLRVRIRTTGVIETQFKVKHLVFSWWGSCFSAGILFMNKIDLFQEKILHSGRHLRHYLPLYKGPDCDVDSAARFIASMFVSQNATPTKLIYHHFTTATDTSNVQVVFQVVMDTIIRENLEAVSLL